MIKDHTIRYKQNRDLLSDSNSKQGKNGGGGDSYLKITVNSPSVTWKRLDGYELKNLEKDFKIADFERRANQSHINKIVKSVLENNFYDNILRVVQQKDGTKIVIDAQHRTQAFKILYERHGLKQYDFMLAIYPVEEARKIYRQLNIGKTLVTADHVLAMDNGKVKFFTELKQWCVHYRQAKKIGYLDVIYGIANAKAVKGKMRGYNIDQHLAEITDSDIEFLKIFLDEFLKLESQVQLNPMYKMPVFRNLMRIAFEEKLDREKINLLIRGTKSILSEFPIGYSSHLLVSQYYDIIRDRVLPGVRK